VPVHITVNYIPDGDDWNITVASPAATGTPAEPEIRRATAPGLIAARDRADQLIEQLTTENDPRTVVHLLNGDAYLFTTTYLHARLGLSTPDAPPASPASPSSPSSPDAPESGDPAASAEVSPADAPGQDPTEQGTT
jgi:hypothetical protein